MTSRAIFLVFLAYLVHQAQSLRERAAPAVNINNGTVVGGQNGFIEYFNQIPYAQPPVGGLRLKPPQPITKAYGTLDATVAYARSCPQFYFQTNDSSDLPSRISGQLLNSPLFQNVTNAGEDCLNLNIVRPAGLASSAKLPVVVWIYGGGFQFGSTQAYKGDFIVSKSVALKSPIIYVAINYRVGGFGFLGGTQIAAEKSTNLGLRDQRFALQWLQDNIAAFGGDPNKVTIWGQSAGAVSVLDQLLIHGGDNTYNGKALFRAAILNSGSESSTDGVSGSKAQSIFDQVVHASGCAAAPTQLACLRTKDYTTLLNAMNSVPSVLGYSSLDLSYLPRYDPSDDFFPLDPMTAVEQGKYARVPIIIGNQEDEGTVFALAQKNLTTAAQVDSYVAASASSTAVSERVRAFTQTYPDDGGVSGSPFNTGQANNLYPQYKRLAAISGDMSFTLVRRMLLAQLARTQACWAYQGAYLHGSPILGSFHASDVPYMFGFLGDNVPTTSLQTYLIAFVNAGDPNALGNASPVIAWPRWTRESQVLLALGAMGNQVVPDSFRNSSYNALLDLQSQLLSQGGQTDGGNQSAKPSGGQQGGKKNGVAGFHAGIQHALAPCLLTLLLSIF